MKNHYSTEYFEWQKKIGLSNLNLTKRFSVYLNDNSTVLDFGCGGGFLLSSLKAKTKIGYDVNEYALINAEKFGIKSCNNLNQINSETLDLIISNSALEHVPNPLEDLKTLFVKLKRNGKIIFSVPHETINWKYKAGDINNHLHTWSPMALGNLFNEAGFRILDVKIYREIGLPKERILRKFIPKVLFDLVRKPYRIFRIILDELRILRIGVDGNIVLYGEKA